jgi:hypothetical protein
MTEPILSINLMIGLGLLGVIWVIYKVLIWDYEEKNSPPTHHSSSSDE